MRIVLALTVAGCAGTPAARDPAPVGEAGFARPLAAYRELGFITGPGFFPAVANFTTLAGPADSTLLLFGLSLPNSALRFERVDGGFLAEYTVMLEFARDGRVVRQEERREPIRVATFAEAGRTDESVVFQHLSTLAPGRYEVTVRVDDANSARGFRAVDTLEIPRYGPGARGLSAPAMVYQGRRRTDRDVAPDLILNPRNANTYGAEPSRLYLEVYGAAEPAAVRLTLYDAADNPVWTTRTRIADGDVALRAALVDLPREILPLGRLFLEVAPEREPEETVPGSATDRPARTPVLVTISDQWLVSNYDEVIAFLDYIGPRAAIDSLRNAAPADRRRLWDEFWASRDPIPATPANEYRDEFFQRVRHATEQFSEPGGLPGWKTHRGEVYIVLGAPAFTQERRVGPDEYTGRANAIEWVYQQAPAGRVTLLFVDRTGLGRYELSPSSLAAFRTVAERLKHPAERASASR